MATVETSPKPYRQRSYLAESLDPIHIGTGEFRLGRVDNTIVREPGTNLPKIPGSSIAGVARAYTAMYWQRYRRDDGHSCAGKGGADGTEHCGSNRCRVCTTYGFSIKNRSFQGLAQFSDARILFFPVYSIAGPVWVTSPATLAAAQCAPEGTDGSLWQKWADGELGGDKPSIMVCSKSILPNPLNLGWLYLPHYGGRQTLESAERWTIRDGAEVVPLGRLPHMGPVLQRLILVPDSLFSTIVEDQLEVRTSVSISPESGAAEPGALFTAEAIPRACFLSFQVTYLDPAYFRVPPRNAGKSTQGLEVEYDGHGKASAKTIEENVRAGLDMIEFLGIGGVNTRGMGRMKVARLGES